MSNAAHVNELHAALRQFASILEKVRVKGMALFFCPQCGHSQTVDDKHLGRNATCPKCRTPGPVQDTAVAPAQEETLPEDIPTERRTRSRGGGPAGVFFNLGPGYDYHPGSSLTLEWIVVDDPAMKLLFTEVCGPQAIHKERQTTFTAEVELQCLDACLSAIDIHFLMFSVWGTHLTTLSGRRIRDLSPNSRHKEKMSWYAGETEASDYIASIGYVARVRTSDGGVLHADSEFVLREARRFAEKFTVEDLEPPSTKKG